MASVLVSQILLANLRAQAEDGRRLAAAQQTRIDDLEARLAKLEARPENQ